MIFAIIFIINVCKNSSETGALVDEKFGDLQNLYDKIPHELLKI